MFAVLFVLTGSLFRVSCAWGHSQHEFKMQGLNLGSSVCRSTENSSFQDTCLASKAQTKFVALDSYVENVTCFRSLMEAHVSTNNFYRWISPCH